MKVTAIYPVLITERLDDSRRFYADLLDLSTAFEADWFVQLLSPSDETVQMGFVARGHDSIPSAFANADGIGALITVEVDDVDAVYERATASGHPIELDIRDEQWGQRHFITRDPNGIAVDVVQVIAVTSEEHAAQYDAAALPDGSA